MARQNSPNIFCRLDYWLISNNLQDLVISTSIIPAIKTDHAAIFVEFGTRDNQMKGPGLWKMNCSILDDEDYIEDITLKIPCWIADGERELFDNRSIWDWIKYNIRAHAIQYSKRRAKERSELEIVLQNDYTVASQKYELNPCDSNANQLTAAKEKLEQFYEHKTKGIIIHARARWHELGERSNKYFLNLEKRNYVKKHMRKLNINETITTNPSIILSEQKRFYQDLYSSGNNRIVNNNAAKLFLNDLNIPKLTEEQKQACEGKILLEECELILETFSNNKAPGNDGIPIEFYKKLWPLKGHSQLCDCVDLDASFSHFEKSLPQPEIKVHAEIGFIFRSICLIFNHLLKNLFLSVLLLKNSIYRVSVTCKLAIEWYVMRMCTS